MNRLSVLVGLLSIAGIPASAMTTDVAELTFDSHCQNPATVTNGLPLWIRGVEQTGGQFNDTLKCWSVAATQPTAQGRLSIVIDRQLMPEDLALGILFDPTEGSDFVVQLLDAENRTIILDLFGNVQAVSQDAKTDTFVVPMRQFATATKIAIRRIKGDLKVYGAVVYPVVLKAEADQATEESLAKLLGDQLSPENPLLKGITHLASQHGVTQRWVTAQSTMLSTPTKLTASLKHTNNVSQTVNLEQPESANPQRFGDGWAVLPFYGDSDWGGADGMPGVVGKNDILLQGRPVRSLASYSLPATVDYDVLLDERAASDGSLDFFLIPAGQPTGKYPKPMTNFRIVYSNTGDYGSIDRLDLVQSEQTGEPSTWTTPHKYEARAVYHARIILSAAGTVEYFINGQKQATPETFRVPYHQFQIQVSSWQPTNRWHLQNVVVH